MMKFVFSLLASAALFLSNGAELLTNGDFETRTMSGWYTTLMSPLDRIAAKTSTWGTDVFFYLEDGGVENWEVSLMQSLAVRKGYRYTITFGGAGIEGDKTVNFGINHNGSTGNGGDGSGVYTTYFADDVTLSKGVYGEFKKVWDDTAINDTHARIFINGGGNAIDFSIGWVSVWESPIDSTASSVVARFNHIGFYSNGSKRIVIKGAADSTFQIRSSSGATLFTGTLGASSLWAPSGETVRLADFSTVKTNGICTLYCGKKPVDGAISISQNPLQALGKAALKAFYYQRASLALASAYAGAWARAAGHPDNLVTIHPSAGSGTLSAPKGWYDAGDYGKYIVSSGITVYTLLALYEHFPKYLSNLVLSIPESNDAVPDLLDEVRWNLEWMLAMQAADGGVYSKLTPLEFDGFIMPDESKATRYAFMKTTPATLDFAAVMAMSSRLYKSLDGTFASRCIEAAKKAYTWAAANPSVKFVQPAGCTTGEYPDDVFTDEFFWASVELALATGSKEYTYHTANPVPVGSVPSWQNVGTLGLYTILTNMQGFPSALVESSRSRIITAADALLNRQKSAYGIAMNSADFYWGSNHVAASQGILTLYAYYLTKNTGYLIGAEQQMDYLLGRNPLGASYVTGSGDRSPLHPHHRISEADAIVAPVPGFLVGGPNTGGEDTASCGNYVDKPATSWLDKFCSYATNEVAINWNATLAYCANALEAIHGGDSVAGFKQLSTQAGSYTSVTAKKCAILLSRAGGDLLLRIRKPRESTANSWCGIYTISGKELMTIPLVAGTKGSETCFEVRVPSRSLAKGYLIVRMESGADSMQQGFINQ